MQVRFLLGVVANCDGQYHIDLNGSGITQISVSGFKVGKVRLSPRKSITVILIKT
ncbi:MAG: hypothetical protein FWH08_07240 [Oscillospiraceae bacterium]|nr:hypothetical protein [Oscillospiraceae bacterium]